MKTSNRERQRKWKQKQISNGMRTVTVMLPVEIKDLIDQKRKETGTTIAQIIETAIVNLLAALKDTPQSIMKTESNRDVEEFPTEELHRIGTDLKAIVHRFETLAASTTTRTAGGLDFTAKNGKRQGREVPQSLLVKPGAKHPVWKAKSKSDVTGNNKAVTDNVSTESEAENSIAKEIYRLVRLLNNMEVSPDEIAFTLNKRKFKTLSGSAEWKLEDVHEVIKDIHQKYGHINPLFSITGNL